MAERPEQSLPKQAGNWAELKAAYRWLNNPRVEPGRIGQVHRRVTREACGAHPVVLCVQDDSDLCAVKIASEQYIMHHTLAVLPGGELLGMLQQRFFERVKAPKGETRKQRAARWRESDVWQEAVEEVGPPPAGCRFVHVADRGSDNLRFMHAAVRTGVGFVVRAHHDRRINDGSELLWAHLASQPAAGVTTARIGTQRNALGKITRRGREAKLEVRYADVTLDEPSNSHETHDGSLKVSVVYLREIDPPEGIEPIDWMLLSSEAVTSLAEALVVVEYYRCRWVIEEWHRAAKEGCRLESSQLTDASALMRLTAVLSVVAVRLIRLRDLADDDRGSPEALRELLPPVWIAVVAAVAEVPRETLTAKQFWRAVAQRGGWPGRRSDGRPGWKAIWTGWSEFQKMVQGIELIRQKKLTLAECG